MPDVPKHAWTHRPKELGGTDPITIEAGAANHSAVAWKGLTSETLTGNDPANFANLWATSGAGYTADTADPNDFEYILLPDDGWYVGDFTIFWSTDFGASTFPFIEPSCVIGGSPAGLVGSMSVLWDDTQGWIGGEQFTAAEQDHHALTSRVWFNYTAAEFDPSFGVGVNYRCSFAGTKSMGCKVTVTWMGDALVEVV